MKRTFRHGRLEAALFLALLLAATGAGAGEDGGGVSIFAYGAGNRALALGGTACAGEEGAELIFWNPGALGRLQRAEFQVGYASLYGLEMGESVAAMAWPNWRWGVLALGVRHFGVNGIEGRDDRNLLTEEGLSDTEQQLSLAFGRVLGEAWSLGGNLKLRRQELAGYSGGSLGLDLGMQLRPSAAFGWQADWLQPLRLGLSLRNVLRPSIRLDQESVTDPSALRAGLAYHGSAGPVAILGALDVEKSPDRDYRIHAGLELRYSLLALRAGHGYQRLAAGLGIRWRELSLDYAFEDNPLEPVHRFGVGFAFGATVADQRRSEMAARELVLEKRFAEGFAARQAERVKSLMDQADKLRTAGDSEGALEILATLLALAPEEARAVALAARCHADRAEQAEQAGDYATASLAFGQALRYLPGHAPFQTGLDRCREAGDNRARRGEILRRDFAAALDAFGANRFLEARIGFQSILDRESGDRDAALMLERTEEALKRHLATLLDQSRRFVNRHFLTEAEELLDQASTLVPDDVRIAALRGRIAEQRAATLRAETTAGRRVAVPRAGPGSAPSPPSAQERQELTELYDRGVAAAEKGRSDDALSFWEMVWSRRPGFRQVDQHLMREYLMRGMELFAAGQLEEAAATWEKALRVDPEDERALGYLTRAREQLTRTREIFKG